MTISATRMLYNNPILTDAQLRAEVEKCEFCEENRKQCNQLFSKMRFISAQYEAYLNKELWRICAKHANDMAALLAKRLAKFPQITITQKVYVNSIFAILPKEWIEPLQEKFMFYTWDESRNEVRLMCNFNTLEEHIDEFIHAIEELIEEAAE